MLYAGSDRSTVWLGRPRRGPLPPGRLSGAGLGGGDHPHAPRCASSACRPRSPTPTNWRWIRSVRGPTDVVVEHQRPVELRNRLRAAGPWAACRSGAGALATGTRTRWAAASAWTDGRGVGGGRVPAAARWRVPRRPEVAGASGSGPPAGDLVRVLLGPGVTTPPRGSPSWGCASRPRQSGGDTGGGGASVAGLDDRDLRGAGSMASRRSWRPASHTTPEWSRR